MGIESIASQLSEIEKAVLKALAEGGELSLDELAARSGLKIDSVRRAAEWLNEKGLAELTEKKAKGLKLTPAGSSSCTKGLPERMLIDAISMLGGRAELGEVKKRSELNAPEMNIAMGIAKRMAWVSITKEAGEVVLGLTGLEKELLDGKYPLEIVLGKIRGKEAVAAENAAHVKELIARGLAVETEQVERKLRISAAGRNACAMLPKLKKRGYNIEGAVPAIYIGKRQPYAAFLSKIRRRLVELGFREMEAPLITQEFYNFDVLFQPQNHPARSWTDTYQLERPKAGQLPQKRIVDAIKAAHENGGKTGSKGWGYRWSGDVAKRVMPAAHGTAHSARQLVAGVDVPGKYFAIARCYRPDVIDANHLIEFNQMEGFVVGSELNFRHLLGMLKSFATEIAGAEKVKFYPDYYPFTEPSVQLSALHPEMGWVEFAGAGVFRPEMMLPLSIKETAIAWGLGIDRLAMFMLGIKDMRQLFSSDLEWLRKQRVLQ